MNRVLKAAIVILLATAIAMIGLLCNGVSKLKKDGAVIDNNSADTTTPPNKHYIDLPILPRQGAENYEFLQQLGGTAGDTVEKTYHLNNTVYIVGFTLSDSHTMRASERSVYIARTDTMGVVDTLTFIPADKETVVDDLILCRSGLALITSNARGSTINIIDLDCKIIHSEFMLGKSGKLYATQNKNIISVNISDKKLLLYAYTDKLVKLNEVIIPFDSGLSNVVQIVPDLRENGNLLVTVNVENGSFSLSIKENLSAYHTSNAYGEGFIKKIITFNESINTGHAVLKSVEGVCAVEIYDSYYNNIYAEKYESADVDMQYTKNGLLLTMTENDNRYVSLLHFNGVTSMPVLENCVPIGDNCVSLTLNTDTYFMFSAMHEGILSTVLYRYRYQKTQLIQVFPRTQGASIIIKNDKAIIILQSSSSVFDAVSYGGTDVFIVSLALPE